MGQRVGFIQRHQPVHALQRNIHHRPVTDRHIQVTHHAGAAAVGNHHGAGLPGALQRGVDFLMGFGQGHCIGVGAELPAAQRYPVRKTLAAGMQHALLRGAIETGDALQL